MSWGCRWLLTAKNLQEYSSSSLTSANPMLTLTPQMSWRRLPQGVSFKILCCPQPTLSSLNLRWKSPSSMQIHRRSGKCLKILPARSIYSCVLPSSLLISLKSSLPQPNQLTLDLKPPILERRANRYKVEGIRRGRIRAWLEWGQ